MLTVNIFQKSVWKSRKSSSLMSQPLNTESNIYGENIRHSTGSRHVSYGTKVPRKKFNVFKINSVWFSLVWQDNKTSHFRRNLFSPCQKIDQRKAKQTSDWFSSSSPVGDLLTCNNWKIRFNFNRRMLAVKLTMTIYIILL